MNVRADRVMYRAAGIDDDACNLHRSEMVLKMTGRAIKKPTRRPASTATRRRRPSGCWWRARSAPRRWTESLRNRGAAMSPA